MEKERRKMAGKPDLAGQRFGSLVVVEPTKERKNGYTMWRCRCDCGKELLVESRRLKRGTIQDCGCIPKKKRRRDLTGQRFGKLVVLEDTGRMTDKSIAIWKCLCDCGNTIDVPGTQLTGGYRRSCGCLSRPPRKDWVGKTFGELTVLEYAGKEKGSHMWNCRCSCGKETVVRQSNLLSGHSRTCGHVEITDNVHFVGGTCVEAISSNTVFRSNTSGVRGVYRNRKTGKWAAQITFKGRTKYLGSYEKIEDAVKARRRAEEEIFGKFLEEYWAENKSAD